MGAKQGGWRGGRESREQGWHQDQPAAANDGIHKVSGQR
jgi:hypothetical protein